MSGGWSWSPVPQRLMQIEAFVELSLESRSVLLMMYLRCDRWGRGPMGARLLGGLIGILDVPVVSRALVELREAGFILPSADGTWWQLAGYDDDMPYDLIRKRGPATYGDSPAPPARRAPASDSEAGRSQGASEAPQSRSGGDSAAPSVRPKGASTAPLDRDRDRDRDSNSVPEGGPVAARAPAHPPAPARTHVADPVPAAPPAPPSPARPVSESHWPVPAEPAWPEGTEEAGREWWARLQVERPMGCGYVLADIQRLAARHGPEAFVAGVADHVGGARGWKRTDPVAWLDRQCTFAAERLADKRTRRAVADADLPAMRKPQPVFADWSFRWDLPTSDPRLDPLWPSAQDLPLEDQIPLARCAHTPEGPIEPPRPLAEVAGALDEYRRRYGGSAAQAAGGAA